MAGASPFSLWQAVQSKDFAALEALLEDGYG